MKRREFLRAAGTTAVGSMLGGWPSEARAGRSRRCDENGLAHVLPIVDHQRMRLKVSFSEPQWHRPILRVNSKTVVGRESDTQRRFWVFDVDGLEPATSYTLELRSRSCPLIEPWQLSTFPAPDARPERFRILIYTCAGGNDIFFLYIPVHVRARLLRRALSFAPDAAIAVGDHVYWDLRSIPSAILTGASSIAKQFAGEFDRTAPVLGHANEGVLIRAVDDQIATLYGTDFRSTPVFFIRDDHDYFEDDRSSPLLTTFPADGFMKQLARATQQLYYPEFLADPTRPLLPGSDQLDQLRGISEAFGTLRYGQLAELLFYDCKGFLSLSGEAGLLIPGAVEDWLHARMNQSDAHHVAHVPSNPVGYSAGKFAEWYPDVEQDGELTDQIPKPGWQAGWLPQHDRILKAASDSNRLPLFLSGDIHSIAEQRIVRSGEHDLSSNPIISLISGTPGTRVGWPSVARGTLAMTPTALEGESVVPVQELNGFHLVDFMPDAVEIRHFRWDVETQSEAEIDSLEPFHVSRYTR